MKKRDINIGIGTINESLKEKDGLKALTLAVMLKAMFGSSVVPNFSIRKIMQITNSRYSTVSLALKQGFKMGLFETFNAKGKVYLKVNKLWDENKYFVRVSVVKKDKESVRIYFENGKHSNFKKNANAKKQTFNDVTDKIIQAKVMTIINNYLKTFDSIVKEWFDSKGIKINLSKLSIDRVRKILNGMKAELKPGELSYINTGLSYDKMYKSIHNRKENEVSRYQIIKAVKACVKEKLVVSYSNYAIMSKEYNTSDLSGEEMQRVIKDIKAPRYDGTNARQIFEYMANIDKCTNNAQREALNERDDEGNIIPNRRFVGKKSKCHTIYKRMANGFVITSGIIGRKHNRGNGRYKKHTA